MKYEKENGCVCVSILGDFTLSILKNIAAEVQQHLAEHDCKCILNDMRKAKLIESATGIYNMPGTALKSGIHRSVKRALVVSENSSEFLFLETVFINQGNKVRLFADIDEARLWLSPRLPGVNNELTGKNN